MKKEVKRIRSNPGSRIAIKYIRKVDSDGFPIMLENEKFNIYEDIQSYSDHENIEKLIKKLGVDIKQIDMNKGIYVDATHIPDSYVDLLNNTIGIASDYSKLPVEAKKLLKNNYNLYYGLAMSGKAKDFVKMFEQGNFDQAKSLISSDNFKFKTNNDSVVNDNNKKGGDNNVQGTVSASS